MQGAKEMAGDAAEAVAGAADSAKDTAAGMADAAGNKLKGMADQASEEADEELKKQLDQLQ